MASFAIFASATVSAAIIVPVTELVTDVTVLGGTLPPNPETVKVPSGLLSVTFNPVAVPSLSILIIAFLPYQLFVKHLMKFL